MDVYGEYCDVCSDILQIILSFLTAGPSLNISKSKYRSGIDCIYKKSVVNGWSESFFILGFVSQAFSFYSFYILGDNFMRIPMYKNDIPPRNWNILCNIIQKVN